MWKICSVFNGEIYNHKLIRKDLEQNKSFLENKYSWEGKSDTETLLASISIIGMPNLEK